MNANSLTFLWTPWSAAASVVLVLVAAGLCFVALAAERISHMVLGLLELLRLALIVVVAVLLNQPEIVHEYRPEEKPSIAVLWDASPSMETRDAVAPIPAKADPAKTGSASSGTATTSVITRREAIAPITDASFWKLNSTNVSASRSSSRFQGPAVIARNYMAHCRRLHPSSRTWSAWCLFPTAIGTPASRRWKRQRFCG